MSGDMNHYLQQERETVIDLMDLLAELITRWKVLMCFLLAGMLLMGCFGAYKAKKQSISQLKDEQTDPEEALERASGGLTTAERADVERIYDEYRIYLAYKDELREGYLSGDSDDKTYAMQYYYIRTDLEGVGRLFSAYVFSPEQRDEILKLAYKGDRTDNRPDNLHKVLTFYRNWDQYTNDKILTDQEESQEVETDHLLTVRIKAEDEDTCRKIGKVVEAAFEEQKELLSSLDPAISVALMDMKFIGGLSVNEIISEQSSVANQFYSMDNALVSLENNYISKFSDGQKAYFELLKKTDEAELESRDGSTAESESKGTAVADMGGIIGDKSANTGWRSMINVKYILIGALLGLLAGCLCIGVGYVADGCVKTVGEVTDAYRLSALAAFFFMEKKHIFSKLVQRMRKTYPTMLESQVRMLSHDVGIMMQAADTSSVYFFETCQEERDKALERQLSQELEEMGYKVHCGNPYDNPNELQQIADSEQVVLLTHLRKTTHVDMHKGLELCRRYGKSVMGTVIVGEC